MKKARFGRKSSLTLSWVSLSAIVLVAALFSAQSLAQSSMFYGSAAPGEARASVREDQIVLENNILAMRWSLAHGAIGVAALRLPHAAGSEQKAISLSTDLFRLKFADGTILRSSAMKVKGAPRVEKLIAEPEKARAAEHLGGQQIVADLEDLDRHLWVRWRAILRDDSNYLRREVAVRAVDHDAALREVELVDFKANSARVVGEVAGSPVVLENAFFGFEHPLSHCAVNGDEVKCSIARELPLKQGQTVTYSSVAGISPPGQMRRGFLNYIERERVRPYRPLLTYNSWYDIGFNNPYNEAAALDVIRAFGSELVEKRHVKLDSFLFDDGWDDPHTLWSFGPGFPNGFTPLKTETEKYGADPGVWLSPWGGYDEAKKERLKYGREQGLETNDGGFALSGPKYYSRFRDVTLKFVREFGVNQFKIDGTGNVNSVLKGSEFDSDFQAAISLMTEWRSVHPKIFVNLTTGTYPSPFWLQFADAIFRGDEDHSFSGVGTWRERWITFRDGATYRGVVQKGPLFPLNSLMLHGIIYAQHAEHLSDDPGKDFANEVHSYFGSGTQLQELYITHSLLSKENWETLAETAKWSRENADVLVDTHWIGGDPNKLEIYGWAAWARAKGILTLRNPSDKAQSYAIDVAQALELPEGAPRKFRARSAWASDHDETVLLTAGELHTFTLRPFEVVNLEAFPK